MAIEFVDWTKELQPPHFEIVLNGLGYPPHEQQVAAELVMLDIAGGFLIEVDYHRASRNLYQVTLSRGDGETWIRKSWCKDVPEVIAKVRQWIFDLPSN